MEQGPALMEILAAREARAREQDRLRQTFQATVISFTMNIPGPIKDSPLIRRGFQAGKQALASGLRAAGLGILCREENLAPTGCEALYAVGGPAGEVKTLCVSIEDGSPLGRLFDMDVIAPDGSKLDREASGRPPRGCMVCGAPGRDCAARRLHPPETLQAAARDILETHFAAADRDCAASLATQALLDEVCVTPKPGLVDRSNNGSHKDMDIFTFTASAAALTPYWARCFQIGRETASADPAETFRALREAGKAAERAMFAATGGVNTHKGAIFTLGTICGAAGRLWRPENPCRAPARILSACAALTAQAAAEDLAALTPENARTAGARLYLSQGAAGIRGEAAQGFPSVERIAIPALREALAAGLSKNDAGVIALLRLIAAVNDTNMIARGGPEAAREASASCARLLERHPLPSPQEAAAIDRDFIRQNLSPGGCADLLAAGLFLLAWESQEGKSPSGDAGPGHPLFPPPPGPGNSASL